MTPNSFCPAALTWSGVTARRMARHSLAEPATGLAPADIARVICGAHAQRELVREDLVPMPVEVLTGRSLRAIRE